MTSNSRALTVTQPDPTAVAVAAPVSSLRSIAEIKQHMAWMTEFRPVLLEYVQKHMDPKRHFYSFAQNRYTPLTPEALAEMSAKGQRPALNQDGIHNLMSLFQCYPDEPTIVESREEGYYMCRATVRLISSHSGQPMGAGTGSCSTRESKYAYRWVSANQVPQGVDKASLKHREDQGRSGTYTRYRLDNDDLADVEATVLQMAVKRAKSAAVKALPLVSEMFAQIGDADEEKHREDAERQAVLAPLRTWLKGLRASSQVKAILAVFGEPLRANDLPRLDEDRLAVAGQVVAIATRAGVRWDSPTLVEEVQRAVRASAAKATADLFSDGDGGAATMPDPLKNAREGAKERRTPPGEGVSTPETILEAASGQKQGMAWDTLRAYRDDARLPVAVLEQIRSALSPVEPASDSEAHQLAGEVLDWLAKAEE